MYDYFVAAMTCPNCGVTSPATSSTNMQTHLRDDAQGIEIGVGFQLDPLEVRDQDIESSGYLPVSHERPDGRIRLLELWTCPTCHQDNNWGRVTIAGTEIVAIEGVTLDRATLADAQFITESCFILAAQVSDIPADDLVTSKVNPVTVLLERLP
jgi:hypothetical protein